MEDRLYLTKEITPQEYFDYIKNKKHTSTDESLNQIYKNAEELLQKMMITKQTVAAKKLLFHLETIEKERELVKLGIDTFVYNDDIEEYIENVANKTIKVIELSRYERDIPDEIVEVIHKVGHLFDELYVVFTDYTGKIEKKIEKERREKDPILFGTFQDKENEVLIDRFYFLGDWVDEYCDLTLDKMVSEMKSNISKDIIKNISTPLSIDDIKSQLATLEPKGRGFVMNNNPKYSKPSLFEKVRTFLNK